MLVFLFLFLIDFSHHIYLSQFNFVFLVVEKLILAHCFMFNVSEKLN